MPVSRRTRIILIVVAVPLVLLFSLILFLKIYFTSDRLKALLVPRIQTVLNRDVSIKGIGLSLFPTFGVKIEGLSIANRRGPGFSERPLVYIDEFIVDVKLFPLLGNRLEVNHLSFGKPSIVLEINRDGEENFVNLRQAQEQERKGGELRIRTRENASLLLSNFEITAGELEFLDQKADRTIRLKDINLRMRIESIVLVNELRTESELKVGSFSYGTFKNSLIDNLPLSLRQKSKIVYQENKLTVEEGELEIQNVRLRMGGTLSMVDEKPSSVDFTVTSSDLDLKQILSLLPKGLLKETENAEVEGNARLTARIGGELGEGQQPEISVEGSLTDGKIRYAKLPKAITNINYNTKFSSTPSTSRLEVTDFSARLGDNPIKMRMVLNNLSDPFVDAQVEGVVNLSQVKEYYPLEAGRELSGLVRAKGSLQGKVGSPATIKGDGTLELRNVSITGREKPIRSLNGILRLNNQQVETRQLKMQYGESDLSLSFTLRNYLSLLFPTSAAAGKSLGPKPSMNVTLSANYFESSPSKEPIVFPPFDVDGSVAISRFVYKGKIPFECTDLQGSVLSSGSVVRLKNLSLRTLDGALSATGTLDLRNQQRPLFDLNADVKDVDGHSFLRRFTAFGEHLFGKLSLGAVLKGELNDTLGFNTKTLSGNGSIHVTDGKLSGYPVMQRLAAFLDMQELREPVFKSWSNAFKISDGKISVPDLKVAASGNDFLLAGWHGFDGSLDYSLEIKLSEELSNRFSGKSVAQQLGSLFKDKEGRVTLLLLVGGTTENPTFRWDTKAAQERLKEKVSSELEKKKEEIREKAKDEVQKKIDEGREKLKEQLKKLLKKPEGE